MIINVKIKKTQCACYIINLLNIIKILRSGNYLYRTLSPGHCSEGVSSHLTVITATASTTATVKYILFMLVTDETTTRIAADTPIESNRRIKAPTSSKGRNVREAHKEICTIN